MKTIFDEISMKQEKGTQGGTRDGTKAYGDGREANEARRRKRYSVRVILKRKMKKSHQKKQTEFFKCHFLDI